MKAILSLDLGTTTGWAICTREGAICSGSQSFKPGRFDSSGMRFLRFQRWLDEIADTTIDRIVYEEVRRHLGVDAAHAYGGFMAQLLVMAEQKALPCEGVPVGTIKKHATGKGNANKELMIASARGRGHNPADDNEADALALLHWAMEQS